VYVDVLYDAGVYVNSLRVFLIGMLHNCGFDSWSIDECWNVLVSENFVKIQLFSENVVPFSMNLLVIGFTAVKVTAEELFDSDEIIEKELLSLSSSSLQDKDCTTEVILNRCVHVVIYWVYTCYLSFEIFGIVRK